MARPTRTEIDAEIVDRAATLFARHGYANTPLQRIADVVGYSKAGLLHHFPTKKAIYRAAVAASRDQAIALLVRVEEVPAGAGRDRIVMEAAVDATFAWPGVSALGLSLIGGDEPDDPNLAEIGLMWLRALSIDPEETDDERMIRAVSAAAGLTVSALGAVRVGLTREWRGFIVATAMSTLGHGGTGSAR